MVGVHDGFGGLNKVDRLQEIKKKWKVPGLLRKFGRKISSVTGVVVRRGNSTTCETLIKKTGSMDPWSFIPKS